jgi:hypothetical protein
MTESILDHVTIDPFAPRLLSDMSLRSASFPTFLARAVS